jgi:hypothetical protein
MAKAFPLPAGPGLIERRAFGGRSSDTTVRRLLFGGAGQLVAPDSTIDGGCAVHSETAFAAAASYSGRANDGSRIILGRFSFSLPVNGSSASRFGNGCRNQLEPSRPSLASSSSYTLPWSAMRVLVGSSHGVRSTLAPCLTRCCSLHRNSQPFSGFVYVMAGRSSSRHGLSHWIGSIRACKLRNPWRQPGFPAPLPHRLRRLET